MWPCSWESGGIPGQRSRTEGAGLSTGKGINKRSLENIGACTKPSSLETLPHLQLSAVNHSVWIMFTLPPLRNFAVAHMQLGEFGGPPPPAPLTHSHATQLLYAFSFYLPITIKGHMANIFLWFIGFYGVDRGPA